MNKLSEELRSQIASYVPNPFSLKCCSRAWYNTVNSPHTKYNWLLNRYGRIHTLSHAVRIGKPFLNLKLTGLLLNNTHVSRYFVQQLKLGYENHGLWGSNIANDVYERILNFNAEYASSNCNDMQLVSQILGSNADFRLIVETGFTPFPLNPTFRTYIFDNLAEREDGLLPNGYATASDLKIMARAIISHPHLLDVWKRMGYHEIIADSENAVVQLTLLDLCSTGVFSSQTVAEKLCKLRSIRFPLTDTVIGNVLLLFRQRLSDVGKSLIDGFSTARNMCKADVLEMCLIDLLDPSRHLEQIDALDYIISLIDDPEKRVLSALEKYNIVEGENDPSRSHRFLKYSLVVYRHMLRFGAKSPVVEYLMREILMVHTQLVDTDDADKLRDADNILDEYYAADVPFDRSLFPLFAKCLRAKLIDCLFEGYLPNLFESEVQNQQFMIFQTPEVDVLTSSTQTKKLQQLWLRDIEKCIQLDEFMNDRFRRQAIDFLALCSINMPF